MCVFIPWYPARGCAEQHSRTGAIAILVDAEPVRPQHCAPERENQQDRIANGVKSGQLTAGGTAKLENQQKGINQQVAADRKANGGTLTKGEKAQVNQEQNQASKNIYNKKHNSATQGAPRM